ncbi:YgfZ/GcvT domain-containing protein [Granulicoccus sp. GXG6511]|uniref:CAF17-like 4Fe-4S cluster assembly/insertion protein YgfZ n=1 Tax=Granulicoccus sp. GXG6511 TaxID=3381351 RepID=UPI003D7D66A7
MSRVEVETGPDAGAAWHYGDPIGEQRLLSEGRGAVLLDHRDVISISGPDRLDWLHSLTTQHLTGLAPGVGTTALVLSPQGHVEHVLYGVDDGDVFWAHTEPGRGAALVEWLQRMVFMRRVEVALRTPELAVVWQPGPAPAGHRIVRAGADSLGGHESFIPRDHVTEFLGLLGDGEKPPLAGLWAFEALRIAAGVPRIFVDTDARTIPNELGVIEVAVHLDKGCYRGQETVARVHTLGRPPRRLVLLHLDGSMEELPAVGAELRPAGQPDGRALGFVGSSSRHHELGPIALGLVKRNTPVDATLEVAGIAAAQEPLVDPEVGLHIRPKL